MGMTDKQFGGFLRQAIRVLKKALEAETFEECKKLIAELLEDYQNTLEE